MVQWKHRLDLRDIWKGNPVEGKVEPWADDNIHLFVDMLVKRVKRLLPKQTDEENADFDGWLYDILEEMQHILTYEEYLEICSKEDNPNLIVSPLQQFNLVLDEFYDWCDENRVWVDKW